MQINEEIVSVIEAANETGRFFCKFISANDIGINGAHQEGIYLAKSAWDIFFPEIQLKKGRNIEKLVNIHIDGYYDFSSRLVYYGKGTRNEYRITRFWTNSPYNKINHVGDLIVFIPMDEENFKVYLLDTEKKINSFIEHYAISLINNVATYDSIMGQTSEVNRTIEQKIEEEASKFDSFPNTATMAEVSRRIFIDFYKVDHIDPDKHILKYIEIEFGLYKAIERSVYSHYLNEPFSSVDKLLEFASGALNRRKSRAGKSLEHHLNFIFEYFMLPFENPGKTEGNKKPDFLFPSNEAYADYRCEAESLMFLGVKTTCKDRWRQVLNEADRISNKYLLTLQQGITANQLDEMKREGVTLVVPKGYHKYYPQTHQKDLWTISQFISNAEEKYKTHY